MGYPVPAMAKTSSQKALTLAQAEQRLQRALERLITVVKKRQGTTDEVDKLKLEKSELEARFKALKGDYDALEKAFGELKASFKSLKGGVKEGVAKGELLVGEGEQPKGAGQSAETEFLKKELERVHKEYKTLDQSFRLLREQYNELQKNYEESGGEADLLKKAPPKAKGEAGVGELKRDLSQRLDKTITALEKLVD